MQKLHSLSLPLQLRNGPAAPIELLRQRYGCRFVQVQRKQEMRIAETAAVSLVAIAAQILIVATVLL
ncbi:MAG TPA: hypothetical protein VKI45_01165 [Allosphingosinicella sp.]|nr:hypothetical protein [Allosphingosinicella sp.]